MPRVTVDSRCETPPMDLRYWIVRVFAERLRVVVTRLRCGEVVRGRVSILEDCFGRERNCAPWFRFALYSYVIECKFNQVV